jgi:hypothetical protein
MNVNLDQDLTIELVLPRDVVRMCVKYQVNPVQVMLLALRDELHERAVLWIPVSGCCPGCGCDL